MKHARLVNAMKKAGFTVTVDGNFCRVEGPKKEVTWYVQEDTATCVHTKGKEEKSDSMTDYFPGRFCRTIKNAVEAVTADY